LVEPAGGEVSLEHVQAQAPRTCRFGRGEQERSQSLALQMRRDVKMLKDAVRNRGEPARLTVAGNRKRHDTVSQDGSLDPFVNLRVRVKDREIRHRRAP